MQESKKKWLSYLEFWRGQKISVAVTENIKEEMVKYCKGKYEETC